MYWNGNLSPRGQLSRSRRSVFSGKNALNAGKLGTRFEGFFLSKPSALFLGQETQSNEQVDGKGRVVACVEPYFLATGNTESVNHDIIKPGIPPSGA